MFDPSEEQRLLETILDRVVERSREIQRRVESVLIENVPNSVRKLYVPGPDSHIGHALSNLGVIRGGDDDNRAAVDLVAERQSAEDDRFATPILNHSPPIHRAVLEPGETAPATGVAMS